MEQWKKARTEQAKGSVQPKNYQKKKRKERKKTNKKNVCEPGYRYESTVKYEKNSKCI